MFICLFNFNIITSNNIILKMTQNNLTTPNNSQFYYQPPSIIVNNVSYSHTKSDVWYWIERANIGKIYDVIINDNYAIVHFTYSNCINYQCRILNDQLEKGHILQVYHDNENKNFWNINKYVNNSNKFDEESTISLDVDFKDVLFPNVTDNRIERSNVLSAFSFYNKTPSTIPVYNNEMNNDLYLDIV